MACHPLLVFSDCRIMDVAMFSLAEFSVRRFDPALACNRFIIVRFFSVRVGILRLELRRRLRRRRRTFRLRQFDFSSAAARYFSLRRPRSLQGARRVELAHIEPCTRRLAERLSPRFRFAVGLKSVSWCVFFNFARSDFSDSNMSFHFFSLLFPLGASSGVHTPTN